MIKINPLYLILGFLTQVPAVFAATSNSGESTNGLKSGLLLMRIICHINRKKAFGGRLLFYYINMFSTLLGIIIIWIAIIFNRVTEINGEIITSTILIIAETIIACLLLSRKFRNKKYYNILRIILGIELVWSVIDININNPSDYIPIIAAIVRILYFSYSKRVRMIFIENNRNAEILYPEKIKKEKIVIKKEKKIKCYSCGNKNPQHVYSCEKCGEVFRESKKKYNDYIKTVDKNI